MTLPPKVIVPSMSPQTSETEKQEPPPPLMYNRRPVRHSHWGEYVAYFPRTTLRILNITMGLLHTTLAVVTLSVANLSLGAPVYATNLTYVPGTISNTSETNPAQIIPNYYELTDLPLTWIVVSFFTLSATAHLGNATVWRMFYERGLQQCMVTTRWIEYFFSASIMIVALAYGTGIREYLLLFAVAMLTASTMPFGFLCELYSRPRSATEWVQPFSRRILFHVTGYIPQLSAWAIILTNFYMGIADGSKPPSFVYIIVWGQIVLFFSFGFVQLVQLCRPPNVYYQGEVLYQVLSASSKGLLGMLLLANVLMLDTFEEVYVTGE